MTAICQLRSRNFSRASKFACPAGNPTEQPRLVPFGKFVFPNTENMPASQPQGAVHQPVAGDVPGEFLFPKRTVAGGLRAVLGTAVPETTVHKDGEFEFVENEIRFAEDFLIPSPAGDFVPAK